MRYLLILIILSTNIWSKVEENTPLIIKGKQKLSKEKSKNLKEIKKIEFDKKNNKFLSKWHIDKNVKFKLPKIMEFRKVDSNTNLFESQDGTSILIYSDKSILNLNDYSNRVINKLKKEVKYKKISQKEILINSKLFIKYKGEFKKDKKDFIIYSLVTEIENNKIIILLTTLKENLKEKKILYNLFFTTIFTYKTKITTFLYDKNKNFSLILPTNWQRDSRTEEGFIFKDISLNILSYKKTDFKLFISKYIETIEKDYSNKIYDKKVTYNNISFRIKVKSENNIIILSSIYHKNGKIYLLTIGGPEKIMLNYNNVIAQIEESFKIK